MSSAMAGAAQTATIATSGLVLRRMRLRIEFGGVPIALTACDAGAWLALCLWTTGSGIQAQSTSARTHRGRGNAAACVGRRWSVGGCSGLATIGVVSCRSDMVGMH